MTAASGFGPLQISDIVVNGSILPTDWHNAISSVIVMRGIHQASTIIIQLDDPKRKILNSPNFFQQGATLEIPDGFGQVLQFVFVQVNKASDQLQLTFESRAVYLLRTITGILNSSNITNAAAFAQGICAEVGVPLVGPTNDSFIQPQVYVASTGTSYNAHEDAWVSLQRIASTLGWRCWESAGTIFFGPDEYWVNAASPPVNNYYYHSIPMLQEFTSTVQLIDYDWDVGGPFGDVTITAMSNLWQYNPGELVELTRVGPASGLWIVASMQRDFFNSQATITCTIPMPTPLVLTPAVTPIVGGRPIFGDSYQ